MKILLLGGTGSMGKALVEILSATEHEVYVTSRSERQSYGNIHYILGDAKDSTFLKPLLCQGFDVLVDFMIYTTEEFKQRRDILLSAGHYIFLSSARVYADSPEPITEKSPRLLEACEDARYLTSDEYALTKARQEDLLRQSSLANYTIVRPYITYNSNRLQLGVYEKEQWLFRALRKKTVVFPRDIADCYTSLTAAEDVAMCIYKVMLEPRAKGETFHFVAPFALKWSEVLTIYAEVYQEMMGRPLKIKYVETASELYDITWKTQVEKDRLYRRVFDSSKADDFLGRIDYVPPEVGLKRAFIAFVKGKREFRGIKLLSKVKMDRLSGEISNLYNAGGIGMQLEYLKLRFSK